MQTIYYKTSSFIRHEGNLVDLAAYRQKLSAVSGDWAPAVQAPLPEPAPEERPALRLLEPGEAPRPPHRGRAARRRVRRLSLALDLCASLAVVVLTLSAAASFLLF
ncbi:MAG TPA: hypothetical protein H9701_01245 [Candidatus Intestinimonas pullistercoris]|uniref:Uncharacterized protein n=1 Tax=Candidatus Intestinimonas pullistercoris TaxID=2838623 RepID=A0A9D2NXB9_9FIRM|nr:hypothetical protein [uncultured Intestinimonas sp.]HJC40165.1 hypothetical protein [Candidatus Intestinimonas pullistercoris]